MKTSLTVLVLLALLTLVPCTPGSAQTPPAPTPSVAAVTAAAPVPADTAEFLATLSNGQTQTPSDLTPAPLFKTSCTTNAQCPTGKLCCYPCGIDGCSKMCLTPVKGRCPLFP
jgi:hypothetical protein